MHEVSRIAGIAQLNSKERKLHASLVYSRLKWITKIPLYLELFNWLFSFPYIWYSGGFLLGRTLAAVTTITLSTSMAARQGPLAMAAHQICLQVWLSVSLLADAQAASGQVCSYCLHILLLLCSFAILWLCMNFSRLIESATSTKAIGKSLTCTCCTIQILPFLVNTFTMEEPCGGFLDLTRGRSNSSFDFGDWIMIWGTSCYQQFQLYIRDLCNRD